MYRTLRASTSDAISSKVSHQLNHLASPPQQAKSPPRPGSKSPPSAAEVHPLLCPYSVFNSATPWPSATPLPSLLNWPPTAHNTHARFTAQQNAQPPVPIEILSQTPRPSPGGPWRSASPGGGATQPLLASPQTSCPPGGAICPPAKSGARHTHHYSSAPQGMRRPLLVPCHPPQAVSQMVWPTASQYDKWVPWTGSRVPQQEADTAAMKMSRIRKGVVRRA
jgi:hypothetical protein